MNSDRKYSFLKSDRMKLIYFSILIFFAFTVFLNISGYFQIGLTSDDYLNFMSAQSSTLKQKLTSRIPFYSHLHFRPLWFLSINFSITLNYLLGAGKDNFILFRIENMIYFYLLIFLTSYLFYRISKKLYLSFALLILCLIYPNNINNICWTIGKVDLLCGIFIMLSLLSAFSYLEKKSFYKIILAAIFFCLGLFTKETAVIIPFITILLVHISFKKERVVELKYLLALEFTILLIYTLLRIYVIGISPGEVVTAFQTPGIISSLSVMFKALSAMIIPYDYLSIQNSLSKLNITFIFYLLLILIFLVAVIFVFVRTGNLKLIVYLGIIFMTSISPNLIAGYFRPQLILIPFLIFYLSLFIMLGSIAFDLKFFKIVLPVLFVFYSVQSFNLIKEWQYGYQNSESILNNFEQIELDKDRKNIIVGLPSRLGQSHMLEYAVGAYNYEKYRDFILRDTIYDIVHVAALDTSSLNSRISIRQISGTEFELEATGDTQYFSKLDGNISKYKDENVIIKLTEKNSFRKFTKVYINLLSDGASMYVLIGKNFIKLN
jgi:hypothetical protein